MNIFNISNLKHEELISKSKGEKYSLSAILTEVCHFKDLFIHHEILFPGRKSSSPHTHTKKEEMILVLEGNPTIHLGNETSILKPGDFIGFKPNSAVPYYFENLSQFEVKLLVICSNPSDDEVRY